MAYAATAEGFPSSVTAPRLVALQRALVWLAGASSAIVFIEPSPYELVTLAATLIFFATGLRLRLVFMPLLLLLFLINIGYSIGAIPFLDKPEVASWIATSWYMAVTVMFFAMVVSEDTATRLDNNLVQELSGESYFAPSDGNCALISGASNLWFGAGASPACAEPGREADAEARCPPSAR